MALGGIFDPLAQQNQVSNNEAWWKASKDEVPGSLFHMLNNLTNEQSYIASRLAQSISLYENVNVPNLIAWQFSTQIGLDGPYSLNIVEQIIDTLHAEIITNRTKPQFFTEGGDWISQEHAAELTQFGEGLFDASDVHEVVAPSVCLDAIVFGTGIAKVWHENGKICASRIFPHEVVVDDIAAALAPPRTIYHVRIVPRDALKAQFADNDSVLLKIDQADRYMSNRTYVDFTQKDLVQVVEAWRLPSGKDKGRHVISLPNTVLLDDEWEHQWFPFVFLRYKTRTKGFWGKGVSEILEASQHRVNNINDKIYAQLSMLSPMLWAKTGTRMKESDLGNEIIKVIESTDPPQYIVSNAVPADLANALDKEIQNAAALVGINNLMMRGEIPPGLNGGSGRALRIYNDTKSKRFMRFARAYDAFHIDLCELMIRTADAASEDGESIEVIFEAKDSIGRAKYNKIKLPEGEYVIKPQPVNFMSDQPSGRLSDIEALMQIFPEELKPRIASLMNDPDLKSATDYLNADEDSIQQACSEILRGRKSSSDVSPSAYLNLDLAIEMARVALLQAKTKGAPVERILDLENWIEMCRELKLKSTPAAAPQMPPAMAPGAPSPAPAPLTPDQMIPGVGV
jgi:hypothetical protein